MPDLQLLAQKFELIELVHAYWNNVDAKWGAEAHTMFTEDGVFQSDSSLHTGREEVKGFYDWRRGRGERVARHLVSNPLVTIEGPDRATVRYTMTIYAVDGVPILSVKAPNSISEVTDLYQRNAAGEWKIQHKTLRGLFRGEEPATIMPARAS